MGGNLEVVPLPQKFEIIRVAENNSLYCYENKKLYKFKSQNGTIQVEDPEVLEIKGDI